MVTGVKDMPAAKLQLVRTDGKFSGYADVVCSQRESLIRYRVDLYAVGPKGVPYK
jgi:hypothetical protein